MKSFLLAATLWFILGLATILTIDFYLLPQLTGQNNQEVQVPQIIGLNTQVAQKKLKSLGLDLLVETVQEYSSTIPKGRIIRQNPQSFSHTKAGRRIWVTLSQGDKKKILPDFSGQSIRQIQITLEQLGLQMGNILEQVAPTLPKGVVFGTSPQAGSPIQTGQVVDILMSNGEVEKSLLVQDFMGLSLQLASQKVLEQGLKLGKIVYRESQDLLPGTIMAQKPHAGSLIQDSMSIHFLVAGQPKQ